VRGRNDDAHVRPRPRGLSDRRWSPIRARGRREWRLHAR
jgi:hypothetical protein